MAPHHLALLLTAALLLGLLTLGLGLQLGRWKVVRWLHHALFLAVCVGVALSGLLGWRSGGWALLPALGALLTMPRTRPGRADHWQRALASAGLFALGAWGAW
ncbi:hypothetical protein QOL99_07255 [Deinococcus sp. MIMF12]|uniref:Uncharacterized protein n=1 Tax=Deinococcus rhizophilus TaxID=3049544 RepID=A0ABT7JG74_9DEIO|nr:hypothetical protein [Deinococcus rhizophilus]MDL2343946.1 hypothetical protein [Deinococcus rhizophilus]